MGNEVLDFINEIAKKDVLVIVAVTMVALTVAGSFYWLTVTCCKLCAWLSAKLGRFLDRVVFRIERIPYAMGWRKQDPDIAAIYEARELGKEPPFKVFKPRMVPIRRR
jgi:hypothetical protein